MSIWESVSQRGWRYSGEIAFNRLVPAWLFRCRRFVIYRLEFGSTVDGTSKTQLSWCETNDQYKGVEKLTYFNREAAAGPVRAVQALLENGVHGGFWMATELFDENELGVRVVLAPKQAWLFAAMVSKEMRGRGIYSEILRFMTSELASQGFQDLLVAVNPDNKPSNFVHKKNSRAYVGKVVAIRCLNWAWCFSSKSIAQKSNFTTNAKRRPIEFSIPSDATA